VNNSLPTKKKNIFMSGGFATNPYLLGKVRDFGRRRSIEVEGGKDWFVSFSD
jgi:hypothetical protein